jgi:type VI secretion system ImpC/EvpB family protein
MNPPPARDTVGLTESVQDPSPENALAADSPSAEPPPAGNLLDTVLNNVNGQAAHRLDRFLAEPSSAGALACWLGRTAPLTKQDLIQLLSRDITRLDALLSRQVNAILHHPRFQQLEASWRGLHYLVEQVGVAEDVKVRVLDVSWAELARDLDQALEFDRSQLFRKVYEEEFGTPGGEPFAVLLGDYEIRHHPSAEHPIDDLRTLKAVGQVAAAAFAPFIAAAHPTLLGIDSFAELERPPDLHRVVAQLEYLNWRGLRDREDSRFVGLTVPRMLLRLPYPDDGTRVDGFRFREDVEDPARRQYLWGNAAYAFGAVLVRAFVENGWLANIRGVQRDPDQGVRGGGLVTGLPVHSFRTDRSGLAVKSSTDTHITDFLEKELGELGFLPLCHCPDTEASAFYSSLSIQKPKQYASAAATASARLSAMLQCLLCASRFAHYLKVMARDRLGQFTGPAECEAHLGDWLREYTAMTTDDDPSSPVRRRYPLREFRVKVQENPYKPGTYTCVIHLRPHFQLDQVVTAVKLTTELAPLTG